MFFISTYDTYCDPSRHLNFVSIFDRIDIGEKYGIGTEFVRYLLKILFCTLQSASCTNNLIIF